MCVIFDVFIVFLLQLVCFKRAYHHKTLSLSEFVCLLMFNYRKHREITMTILQLQIFGSSHQNLAKWRKKTLGVISGGRAVSF